MQRRQQIRRLLQHPVLAGALLVLVLIALLASVSPGLHAVLHAENETGHHCLATDFQNGGADVARDVGTVLFFQHFLLIAQPIAVEFPSAPSLRLPPGRGPPVLA
jgi:hypothetical protein